MTTRELIQTEIAAVPEERLEELYTVIKDFNATKEHIHKPGVLSRLKEIKIDAPEDFASNLDQYLSGEKRIDDLC